MRILTSLLAAGLAVLASAHAARASALVYTRGPITPTIGAVPADADLQQQFRGAMSFGMTMNRLTWVDTDGILTAILIDAGNEAIARMKAEEENRKRANPLSTIAYSWEVVDPSPGLTTAFTFAWGNGQGGTFGGQSLPAVESSSWAADLDLNVPLTLVEGWASLDADWDLSVEHYHLSGLPTASTGGLSAQPKYDETSFQAPIHLGLYVYPLPWLRVGPTVGYDPVMGLFALLVSDTPPQNYLYYGAAAEARLFSFVHLSAGYQVQKTLIGLERTLDNSRLFVGGGLEW